MQLIQSTAARRTAAGTVALGAALALAPHAAFGFAAPPLIHPPGLTSAVCEVEATVPLLAKRFEVRADRGNCAGTIHNEAIRASGGKLRGRLVRDGECGWKVTDGTLRLTLRSLETDHFSAYISTAVETGSVLAGTTPAHHADVAYTSVATLAQRYDRTGATQPRRRHCHLPNPRVGTVLVQVTLQQPQTGVGS